MESDEEESNKSRGKGSAKNKYLAIKDQGVLQSNQSPFSYLEIKSNKAGMVPKE